MKKTKWKTVSTKTVHTNPYFAVTKNDVIRSNGNQGTYWVVDRYGSFAIIIPVFPDNTTLLVGQYRFAVDYYSWELPMGQVRGKKPLDMAKQELKEETGFVAKNWGFIGQYFIGLGHTNQEAFAYIATDLIEGRPSPEPGEDLEIKRVSFENVSEMIRKGEIKDGPTIAVWHLFLASDKR